MSNDQFLIYSYFMVGAFVTAIGLAVYAYLHRPFDGITRNFRSSQLGVIFRRLFPVGLVLPALIGFLLVDYRECFLRYAEVVADRSYLIHENQHQIWGACLLLGLALLVWGVIVLIGLATQKGDVPSSGNVERTPQ